jgi:putative peptide zinc metalloprotease protein
MIVPFLRQDLQLLPGSSSEHGSPTWLLYDVLRNKYFSIGRTAFQLISNWSGGIDIDQFIKKIQNKGLSIKKQDTEDFINFLKINSLIIHSTRHDVGLLVKEKESQEKNWLIRLIHNYLFFRIPLVKPDKWLKQTLPLARLFSSKLTRYTIYILGAIGLYLVVQQWEYFLKTFLYFFTWDGFIFYALALFFIKALHELGHAYTAKHFGCNVPSMGLAMLVFFPFLYTDTTNAWRLRNQKDRLKIDLSGVSVELHLALLSTFIWAILPDGTMKSIAFFIATTGWIASLAINISPFMKFDGYYVLSDWLKADNLQPRSFALAKWKLRRFLFDFKDAPPELLENSRINIFIIYAWFTWLYRFTLFIGLAFLIYNYAFKVLGIFLFAVEIIWFIGLPIFKEILTWYKMKSQITFSLKTFRTIFIIIILFLTFFYPWQSNITLPAIYSSENFTTLYPSEDSKIIDIKIQLGQKLKKMRL